MRQLIGLVILGIALSLGAADRQAEAQLQRAIDLMETKGDLPGAIKLLTQAAKSSDRNLAARSLLCLGDCRRKLGEQGAAAEYERVLREFPDQRDVAGEAKARLASLHQPRPARTGLSTRQVWSGRKVDLLGTITPDGRYLSCVDWDTGNLALHDFTTGEDRRLTNKGGWSDSDEFAEESAISRDGKQVAYAWFNKDFRYDLRVMDLNGAGAGKPRVLFESKAVEWIAPYDWSPGGKWIAVRVQKSDRTTEIGLVSTETGAFRVLAPTDWAGVTKMVFSPDGKHVAYDHPAGPKAEGRDIFVIPADGSGRPSAVSHPANEIVLGWTADGKYLLFVSDRTGSMDAWAAPVAGGEIQGTPVLVKSEIGSPRAMGISREGALYYGISAGSADVFLGSIDLESGKMLTPPTRAAQSYMGFNRLAEWSPDGKYLAYVSLHDRFAPNANTLVVQSVESGAVHEVRHNLVSLVQVRWAPDGKSVAAVSTDRTGRHGIFRIDVQTGAVTPLVIPGPGIYSDRPQWSSDGRTLYYARYEIGNKEAAVMVRDLASGAEREILRRSLLGGSSVSPDERQVAFIEIAGKSRTLLVMPAGGGEARQLYRREDASSFTLLAWSPDSRFILLKRLPPDGQTGSGNAGDLEAEVLRIPAAGGPALKLELSAAGLRNLRFHPDGKRIAFAVGEPKNEVWVLENFLPMLRSGR